MNVLDFNRSTPPKPSFIFISPFLSRLFGLKDVIILGNCSYDLNLNAKHDWPVYVNLAILFFLYITTATVLKTGCHGTTNQVSATSALSLLVPVVKIFSLIAFKGGGLVSALVLQQQVHLYSTFCQFK